MGDDKLLNEIARLAVEHQQAANEYDRKFNLPWYLGGPIVGFVYSYPAWRRYVQTMNVLRHEQKRYLGVIRRRIQMRWGYN